MVGLREIGELIVDCSMGLFVMGVSSSAWVAIGVDTSGAGGVMGRDASAMGTSMCSVESSRGFRRWRKYRFSTSFRFCRC